MSKPRYRSAAAIEGAIDRCHAESKRKLAEAEAVETQAQTLFNVASQTYEQAASTEDKEERAVLIQQAAKFKDQGNMKKEEVRKLRVYATNLVEKKSKKLGHKLAEFNTAPMLGIIEDKSVAVKL